MTWNPRLDDDRYHRRDTNETVDAAIEQKFGAFVDIVPPIHQRVCRGRLACDSRRVFSTIAEPYRVLSAASCEIQRMESAVGHRWFHTE